MGTDVNTDANIVTMDGIKEPKNSKTNKMKKIIFGLSLLLNMLLISCKDDNLNNNEVDIRNEFTGNWLVIEKSKIVGERNFEITINKDPTVDNKINIRNFYALGNSDSVFANVSTVEINTFIIPYQLVRNNGINGNGALSDNNIEMVYYVDDGNSIDTISATFTRVLL